MLANNFYSSAYWKEDEKNKCTKIPGSNSGFSSWSMVCNNVNGFETNCQDTIKESLDSKFWQSGPKYVVKEEKPLSQNIGKFWFFYAVFF